MHIHKYTLTEKGIEQHVQQVHSNCRLVDKIEETYNNDHSDNNIEWSSDKN